MDATKLRSAEVLGAALDDEPLFHLSIGSKELFHSNMLAWFALTYPTEARELFAPWTGDDAHQVRHDVEREHADVDLVVRLPGLRRFIVENKMFSLPDERHLDRYAEARVAHMSPRPALLLLSLAAPPWDTMDYRSPGGVWRLVSYEELAERLRLAVPSVRAANTYDGDTVEHYVGLVERLVELQRLVGIDDEREPVVLTSAFQDALGQPRIVETAQKLRMHELGSKFRARLGTNVRLVQVKSDFTFGTPLLEAFVTMPGDRKVGWQYHAGHFRLALVLPGLAGRGEAARRKREDFAIAEEAWFDFTELHAIQHTTDEETITTGSRMAGERFSHFDPDFVYRQRRSAVLTVGQLLDLAARTTRRALEFAATRS